MTTDLYILFLYGIISIGGLYLIYISYAKYEVAVFLFALTPLLSVIFYENLPAESIIDTEATIGIGGMLRAIVVITLGVIGFIRYFTNISKNKWKAPIHIFLLAIFIFFAVLSVVYSIDQKFTLIRSGLLFAVFGFLVGFNDWLKEEGNIQKALNSLFILSTLVIIVTLVSLFIIPNRVWWWKAPRLIGLWEQPNTYGAFSMLCYPILIWKFYTIKNNNKYFVLIIIAINIVLHLLTGSRTTVIASSIGVLVWLILEMNWIKLFSAAIVLGLFLIIILNYSPESFRRLEGSQITDLSSREDIWASAQIFIKEKPILGYGFGVEGKIFQDELKVDLEGSFIERSVRQSLHNGYLSILVGGGIIGLTFWVLILLLPLGLSITAPFSPEKAYATFTVIVVLITNFVESALTGYSLPSDIFFWLAWVVLGSIWFNNRKN